MALIQNLPMMPSRRYPESFQNIIQFLMSAQCLNEECLKLHRLNELYLDYQGSSVGPYFADKQKSLKRYSLVHQILTNSGIKHVFIKGIINDALFYHSKGLRHYYDMDILISRKDLKKAKQSFCDSGFSKGIFDRDENKIIFSSRKEELESELYTHETVPLVKILNSDSDKVEIAAVDLNFYFSWIGFGLDRHQINIITQRMIANAESINIDEVSLPVLNLEDHLIHAIAHCHNEARYFLFGAKTDLSKLSFQYKRYYFRKHLQLRNVYELMCLFENCRIQGLKYHRCDLLDPMFDYCLELIEYIKAFGRGLTSPFELDWFYSLKKAPISWKSPVHMRICPGFALVEEVDSLIK